MAFEPEILIKNVTRDDSENAWVVKFAVKFLKIGYFTDEVRVPISDDRDASPRIERTVGEASDLAHKIVVTDLLRTVLHHSRWLDERARDAIVTAFPRSSGENADASS